MRVGFIGLGNMGEPMSLNLRRAGSDVVVHNRTATRPSVRHLAEAGAQVATSPAEVARLCDVVCTCVTFPADSDSVYLGPQGLLTQARPGQLFIEHATIGPAQAKQLSHACQNKSARFIDAPVSGGVTGAAAATLTIMVGGSKEDFETARPVLEKMGKTITHIGPVGAGSVVKLMNQFMLAVNLAGLMEGFILAKKAGVDPTVAFEAIKVSSGASATMVGTFPRIMERDFQPRFALKLLHKDIRLALELADEQHVRSQAGAAARRIVEESEAQGFGDLDFAAMVRPIEAQAGVELAYR